MSKSSIIQSLSKDSGYRCITGFLSELHAKTDVDIIFSKISLIIENMDVNLFVLTLKSVFDQLAKPGIADIHKQQLLYVANHLIQKFLNYPQFHSLVSMIFNSYKAMPPAIAMLDITNSLALLVFSDNTPIFNAAKDYISKNIIPKLEPAAYENLPETVLYELSNLLPDFQVPDVVAQNLPVSLSLFSEIPTVDNKLSLELSNPPLYDAVIESEPRSLISLQNLERLFSFFQDFNAAHAASYLTAISSSSCSFRQFFDTLEDMQKDRVVSLIITAFSNRKVDPTTIVNNLDQPSLKPLDKDGCAMLFSFLSSIHKDEKQKIDAYPFVIPWDNTRAQLEFLLYITNTPSCVTFSNKCRMIPAEILNNIKFDSNNCWACIDLVERFIELANIYPKDVTPYLQSAVQKNGSVMIFSLSQVKEQNTKEYVDFINYLFNILLFSGIGNSNFFEEFWKYSSKFCTRAIFLFAKNSPQKLTKVAETFSSHLKELMDSDNLEFSIDLAFNVTIKDSINIDEFIDSLVAKSGQDILVTFLQIIKVRALDSQPASMQVFISTLNSVFKWLSNHFTSLKTETQLLANALYSICENVGNGIQKFNFAEHLPVVNPPDAKHAPADYFKSFLDGETTLDNFLLLFHQLKAVNSQIFESMIHYLLLELNYMSSHDTKVATKLGELVGNMVLENLFGESQLAQIFSTFQKTYSEEVDPPLLAFSSTALNICYTRLTKIPIYVFNLTKQPQFKQREPLLFKNLKKIANLQSTPMQLSQTTKLSIHAKIRRFEKLAQPPPRLRKILQSLNSQTETLDHLLQSFQGYTDWLALHLVEDIEDHPAMLQTFLPNFIEHRAFAETIIQAASFEVYNLVDKSNDIATYEGGFKRRRLSILGRLIGNLTFAQNRPLLSKYIDIKKLLLYALTHGKLFGVLPFVSAVLRCANSFFNPPNPYMSSILQVLASISNIDLLKLSIKNQINLIMSHFNVSPAQFILLQLIPNFSEGNFDFITAPFSLNYVMPQAEIDKIISFDDSAFHTLASQHFVVPEYNGPNAEEKQKKFRDALTAGTLSFLKTEGKNLSQVAASTASELIMKDFVICNNIQLINQTAETLTKQLSASLAMFTVFQKQQIYLNHNVQHELPPEDADWVAQGVQSNHNWIGQLLKDVVYLKAWKSVQKSLADFEQQRKDSHNTRHQDPIPQRIQHLIPPSVLPTEQGLLPQHNTIYQDLSELALNPAQIAVFDKPSEKLNKSIDSYEQFFAWVSKRISAETSNDVLAEHIQSLLTVVYEKIPDVGPTFESFMCLIRTMMKYMYKNNHRINDAVFSKILEKIVSDAQPGFVVRMQPFLVSWLRNYIPSVHILCEFLKTNLLTTKQLDRFFFDQLNRQPFNGRLFQFAVRFLLQTLVEKQPDMIKPSDMIDSISFVVSTPTPLIEAITPQTQQLSIDELQKVLDNMDVPLNILSTNSKLQNVSLFDPVEDLTGLDKIQATFGEWKLLAENTTIEGTSADGSVIVDKTTECIEFGRNFFVFLFYSETEEIINKFLACVFHFNMLDNCFNAALDAIELVIQGNASVISFDMRKYYEVIIRLITAVGNSNRLINIAAMLHNLRPLQAPSFTFSWTQLVTHNHFVSYLISNAPDVMKILIEDYTVSATYLQGAHTPEAFDVYYRSLLRFILILVHDFPEYMNSIALEVVSLFGFHFTQLRNIFLSVSSSPSSQSPNIKSDPHSFDAFSKLVQPMPELSSEYDFESIVSGNEEAMRKFTQAVEKRSGTTALTSFVVYAINKKEGKDLSTIMLSLVDKASPETLMNVLHVFFDQLRTPGRVTSTFIKILLNLFTRPKLDELILTIAVERFSTPSPQPWGIRVFVRMLVLDKEINISGRKFIADAPEAQQFIDAIKKSIEQQMQL